MNFGKTAQYKRFSMSKSRASTHPGIAGALGYLGKNMN